MLDTRTAGNASENLDLRVNPFILPSWSFVDRTAPEEAKAPLHAHRENAMLQRAPRCL
jgi:hypothetical protein